MKETQLFTLFSVLKSLHFARGVFILFLMHKGFTGLEIGTLQSILFWTNLVSEIPTGYIADRFGRKTSLMIGILLLAANALGFLLSDGFLPYLGLFVMQGLALSFMSGADDALLFSIKSESESGSFTARLSRIRKWSETALGFAIVTGGLMSAHSWEAVYLSYFGAMLLAAFFLSRIPEPKTENHSSKEQPDQIKRALGGLLSGKGRVWGFVVGVAVFEAFHTPFFIFNQAKFENMGMHPALIAVVVGGVQMLSPLMYQFVNILRSRLSLLVHAQILFGLCFVATVASFHSAEAIGILLFLVINLAAQPFFVIYDAWFQESFAESQMATALSVKSALTSLFVSASFLGVGSLSDHYSASDALLFSSALPLLGAAVCVLSFTAIRARTKIQVRGVV